MAQFRVVMLDGRPYRPLRYDNFQSIHAVVEPAVPCVLVPMYRDIAEVVAEANLLQKQLTDSLDAMGVMKAERMLQATLKPESPPDDHEFAYRVKLDFPFRFFRGERSLRFSIMPTRYRFSGQPDPAATTQQRIEFETGCAAKMSDYLKRHGAPEASPEQARAAARHFGAPSSFVDFTFDPEVAAYFGHPPFNAAEREHGGEIGILYSLGVDDFDKLFGMSAWGLPPGGGRDIHYININRTWQIPYLSFDLETNAVENKVLTVPVPENLMTKPMTIRTRIVPAIGRIAGQEGLFIELDFEDPSDRWSQVFLWTILDFASRKWCYLRQDHSYQNEPSGITDAKLFPVDDPELAELTKDFGSCP